VTEAACGIAQAKRNATAEWLKLALQCVRAVAIARHEFTADDVMALMDRLENKPETHNLRAMGAVVQSALRAGWIVSTNKVVNSKRKGQHAQPKRVWKSVIFKPAAARHTIPLFPAQQEDRGVLTSFIELACELLGQ
jgi:hypothetical protein